MGKKTAKSPASELVETSLEGLITKKTRVVSVSSQCCFSSVQWLWVFSQTKMTTSQKKLHQQTGQHLLYKSHYVVERWANIYRIMPELFRKFSILRLPRSHELIANHIWKHGWLRKLSWHMTTDWSRVIPFLVCFMSPRWPGNQRRTQQWFVTCSASLIWTWSEFNSFTSDWPEYRSEHRCTRRMLTHADIIAYLDVPGIL